MTLHLSRGALALLAAAASLALLLAVEGDASTSAAGAGPASEDGFAVLERPASDSDRASRAVGAFSHGDAQQAAASRRPALPAGSPDVRVVPRERDLCLLVETAGSGGFAAYGCATWDEANAGRLHVTLSGGPEQAGGQALLVGLVPDSVRDVRVEDAAGQRRLDLYEGVYLAVLDAPRAVLVGDGGGQERIDLAGLPGGAQ